VFSPGLGAIGGGDVFGCSVTNSNNK